MNPNESLLFHSLVPSLFAIRERLLLADGGNGCTNPQPDIRQRERESPGWKFPLGLYSWGSGNPVEDGQEELRGPEGVKMS